ncbi:M48 family metallopeptidase [Gemmobacter denitrificans]|uniref:SprT family zinc-dependent metalloprotease n=1 Tax=Gemmobacter denitrificans TaxID=3123040 RepID=A0ABU8BRP5_9RHOB
MPSLPPARPEDAPIEITLRRSARARRFSLRVSRLDGRVTLSLPQRAREADALAFARAQEGWIRRALSQISPGTALCHGAAFPFEGRLLQLGPASGRQVQITDTALLLPGTADDLPRRLAAFLRLRARDRLAAASDHYARLLGRSYRSLTLRDTRSRWGSCTHDGRLMYSWRLIMAPPEVLNYVAAHEVAHLAQMNHSPAFWAEVARLMPGYETPRRWLKSEGQTLQGWRFDTA